MKIIQVIDSLTVGGAERMCVNISSVLDRNLIENGIICTRRRGNLGEKYKGLLWVLNKKSGFDILAFIRLLIIITKYKPNILHAHSTSLYWCAALKFFFPHIKLIWHDHDGESEFLFKRKKILIKFCLTFVKEVIVVNEILLNWYEEILPHRVKKFHFIRNFPILDCANFNFENRRSCFDVINILQVANFREQKHLLLALDVLRMLIDSGISVRWRFVGNIVEVEYYKIFLRKVEELSLNKHLEIINNSTEVEPHLKWADIGVLTSNSEGLPVSLLEYGLANLPVIVTDVGQCSEVIKGGKFGKLSNLNPKCFSLDISEVILNITDYQKRSSDLKRHIEINFGFQGFLKNYMKIID